MSAPVYNVSVDGNSNDSNVILGSTNGSIAEDDNHDHVNLANKLAVLENALNLNSTSDLAQDALVATNASGVANNASGVVTNASGVATNLTRLDVHEGLVLKNIDDISSNVATLAVHEGLVTKNIKSINQMNTLLGGCASRVEVSLLRKKLETYEPVFSYPKHSGNFSQETVIEDPLRMSNIDNETVNELVTMYNTGLTNVWNVEQKNKINNLGVVMNVDNIVTNTDTLDNLNNHNLMNILPLRDFTLNYKFSVASKSASARHFMFNINISGDSYISNVLDMTDLSTCIALVNNSTSFSSTNNFHVNTFYNVEIIKVSNTMSIRINGSFIKNVFSNIPSSGIYLGFLANPNITIKGIKMNIVKANVLDGYENFILESYRILSLPDKNILVNGWFTTSGQKTVLEIFEIVAGLPRSILKTKDAWGADALLSVDGKYLVTGLFSGGNTKDLLLYDISSGGLKYLSNFCEWGVNSPIYLNGNDNNGIDLYMLDKPNKTLKYYSLTGITDTTPSLIDYSLDLPTEQFEENSGYPGYRSVRGESNYFLARGLTKVYVVNLEGEIVAILDPEIKDTSDNYATRIEAVTGELYDGHLYIGIMTALYNTITGESATGGRAGPNLIPPERCYSQLYKGVAGSFDSTTPYTEFSVIKVQRGNYETAPEDKLLNTFTNPESEMMNIGSKVVVVMNRKSGFRYYDVYSLETINGEMKMVFSGRVNAPKDDVTGGFVNKVCICKDYIGSNGTGAYEYNGGPSALSLISIKSIIDSPDKNFYAPSFLTDTNPDNISRDITVDAIPIHPLNNYIGVIETSKLLTISGDLLLDSHITYPDFLNSLLVISNNEYTTFHFNGVKYTWDLNGRKTFKGDDNSILTFYESDEIHNVMGTTPKGDVSDFYTSGFVILKDGVSTVYSAYDTLLDGSNPDNVYNPYTWIWQSPGEYGILFQNGSRINTTYSVSDFFQTTQLIGYLTTTLTWHNPPMAQFVYYAYATSGALTITGNNLISINVGTTYTDEGAIFDILDTQGTYTLNTTSNVDTSVVGSYTVTYTALVNLIPSYIDSGYWGNVATATITKTRVVNVI